MKISTTTPQFRAAAKLLGGTKPVELVLWAYGMIESTLNINTPDSPAGAQGIWQVLPSTQKALKKAYDLPPFDKADPTVQSQYALAHVLEDARVFKRLGAPAIVTQLAPNDPKMQMLLSLRYYYHNGPKKTPRKGHEADIAKATIKYHKMLQRNSSMLTGDFDFDVTQIQIKPYEKYS